MKQPLIAGSVMRRCGQAARCERLCRVKLARLKPPGGMAPERASCGPGAAVPDCFTPADHTDSVGSLYPSLCHPGAGPDSLRSPRQKSSSNITYQDRKKLKNTHRLDPILKELQRLECKSNVKSVHNASSVSPA